MSLTKQVKKLWPTIVVAGAYISMLVERAQQFDFVRSKIGIPTMRIVDFVLAYSFVIPISLGVRWIVIARSNDEQSIKYQRAREWFSWSMVALVALAIGRLAAPSPDRILSDQQTSDLAIAIGGNSGHVLIHVESGDREAMAYANQLAEAFRSAQWPVDGPKDYKVTSKLGTPGVVIRYGPNDSRAATLLSTACALGIQIKGNPVAPSEFPDGKFVMWVGRNPQPAP